MELKSNRLCVTVARASKMSKGPTNVGNESPGTVGNWMPSALRLRVWLCSVIELSRSGSRADRACADRASACFTDSPDSCTRVLPSGFSAISTAWCKLSRNTSGRVNNCSSAAEPHNAVARQIPVSLVSMDGLRYRRGESRFEKRDHTPDGPGDVE